FDLSDALLDPIDHLDRVLALAHHDDPRHHFTDAVQIGNAAPQVRTDRHFADVADPDRCAALARGNDDVLEIGGGGRIAAASNHVLRAPELDQPTGGLRIATTHRLDDALNRHPVVPQAVRIDVDLVLTAEAAERRHFGYAGHGLQLIPKRPILI